MRRRRRAGRAASALVAFALAVMVVWVQPAGAHSAGGLRPTNYRSQITGVSPAVAGLEVRLLEMGGQIEVRNRTGEDVTVLGYQNEPYLRVGPGGVFENRRSPTRFQNETARHPEALVALPPEVDPLAPPDWQLVSGGDRVSWSDDRTSWDEADPPAVREDPGRRHVVVPQWTVALLKGPAAQPVVVTGRVEWIPGPSTVPYFAAAALLFALGLAAGAGPGWPRLLSGALALLVVGDMLRLNGAAAAAGDSLAGTLLDSPAGVVEAGAWLVGAWAVARILRGRPGGLYGAMAAGLSIGFVSGVGDLLNLAYSQVPSSLPATAARAAVPLCLGLGCGVVGGAFLALRRLGPAAGISTRANDPARKPA